jgi:hypothetical protein
LREIETNEFDGKCSAFIEGYRYIPSGEVWVNAEGVECSGVSPWKPYTELYIAQLEYELADADAALNELGVNVDA